MNVCFLLYYGVISSITDGRELINQLNYFSLEIPEGYLTNSPDPVHKSLNGVSVSSLC